MAGNREGGLKTAAKNKQLFGADFYRHIGGLGGKKSRGGGFAANPELASLAGQKGGKNSWKSRKNRKPKEKSNG